MSDPLPFALKLDPRRERAARWSLVILLPLSVVLSLGPLLWVAAEWNEKLREDALWGRGARSEEVAVQGRLETTNFLLHEYDLEVGFVDADGQQHEGQTHFRSLWTEAASETDPVVVYDPADPHDFVLNWEVELGAARLGPSLFVLVTGLVMAVMCLAGILSGKRRLRTVQATAAAPVVRVLEVRQIVHEKVPGANRVRCHFTVPLSGGGLKNQVEEFFPKRHQHPLFADADQSLLVALAPRTAPDSVVVLHEDGYPFALDEQQRAAILAQAHALLPEGKTPA